ncbi:MAG: hypothetical protein AXA67_03265 [Methylothermaceae bacteria B42]|nr:MAG: hypothetical protein AXA67_03265 [Methylothermaceae bacteria B42]HHJ38123.1 MarR family transcriptional regulator [Methylothermaceae bacterium]
MTAFKTYHYLERLGNLIRAEARKTKAKLQPVQLEMLHYLNICNRYSDTPAAITEYLGLTKGTVSQSLSVLESKGYLSKTIDKKDRRVVHLKLTKKGRDILAGSLPPKVLTMGLERLPPQQHAQIIDSLHHLLSAMQESHGLKTFGECRTCHRLNRDENGYSCQLTGQTLREEETELICREHLTPKPPATNKVA